MKRHLYAHATSTMMWVVSIMLNGLCWWHYLFVFVFVCFKVPLAERQNVTV
jgi:hypothetical protein